MFKQRVPKVFLDNEEKTALVNRLKNNQLTIDDSSTLKALLQSDNIVRSLYARERMDLFNHILNKNLNDDDNKLLEKFFSEKENHDKIVRIVKKYNKHKYFSDEYMQSLENSIRSNNLSPEDFGKLVSIFQSNTFSKSSSSKTSLEKMIHDSKSLLKPLSDEDKNSLMAALEYNRLNPEDKDILSSIVTHYNSPEKPRNWDSKWLLLYLVPVANIFFPTKAVWDLIFHDVPFDNWNTIPKYILRFLNSPIILLGKAVKLTYGSTKVVYNAIKDNKNPIKELGSFFKATANSAFCEMKDCVLSWNITQIIMSGVAGIASTFTTVASPVSADLGPNISDTTINRENTMPNLEQTNERTNIDPRYKASSSNSTEHTKHNDMDNTSAAHTKRPKFNNIPKAKSKGKAAAKSPEK